MDELVENAVDELRRVGGAVALGEFDRFVDRDAVGGVGIADLVGAEAEEVAVGGGHAGDRPVLGLLGEEGVEFVLVPLHAEDELLGELAHLFFLQARGEEGAEVAQGVFGVEVFLEQRLEGDLAGATTTGHGYA